MRRNGNRPPSRRLIRPRWSGISLRWHASLSCHDERRRAAHSRTCSGRRRRSRGQAVAVPADAVPARHGRRLALQGSVPLGGHLWHRCPASLRVRFLFDAVSGGDGFLRRDRSGGGGRLVAPPPPRGGGGGCVRGCSWPAGGVVFFFLLRGGLCGFFFGWGGGGG